MARYVYHGTSRDGTGAVIEEATVSIVDAGTSTPSTVYAAETGGSPVSSVTSDSRGNFEFWVDTSDYIRLNAYFDLSVSKTNYRTCTKSKVSPEGMGDLTGSATWNPGSIANGAEEAKEVTVTGAALGDFALASFSLDVSDLLLDAHVTADNIVTCVFANNTGGAIDLASGSVYVLVIKNPLL